MMDWRAEEVREIVKKRLQEKSKKYTSTYGTALTDILEIIDTEFLETNESIISAEKVRQEKANRDIQFREEVLTDCKRILDEKITALNELNDDRAKHAYLFADQISIIFSSIEDKDVREYVSYALYAYLIGKPLEEEIKMPPAATGSETADKSAERT